MMPTVNGTRYAPERRSLTNRICATLGELMAVLLVSLAALVALAAVLGMVLVCGDLLRAIMW